MKTENQPDMKISHLHRADGSATYSEGAFTIIGAVNGPVEAQRRDELAEEAVIDVTVRPASGVGGMQYSLLIFDSCIQATHMHYLFSTALILVVLMHYSCVCIRTDVVNNRCGRTSF